jgi:hypothetical protein
LKECLVLFFEQVSIGFVQDRPGVDCPHYCVQVAFLFEELLDGCPEVGFSEDVVVAWRVQDPYWLCWVASPEPGANIKLIPS